MIYKQEVPEAWENGVWLEAEAPGLDADAAGKGLSDLVQFSVYRVTDHSRINIGRFSLAPMPGCCGVVVSCFTHLNESMRHTGLSDPFRALKEKVARELGYSVMLMTTELRNIPAVANAIKSKYHIGLTFRNKRTDHDLGLGWKVIK